MAPSSPGADVVAAPGPAPDPTADPTAGHPFPQLRRPSWTSLNGDWDFAHDDAEVGLAAGWPATGVPSSLARTITVPFPPESALSGIGDTGYHPVVWYSRTLTPEDLAAAGLGVQGERLILHLGAVDYRASVWVAGQHVADHEGGHVPFAVDITQALADGSGALVVVRAEDRPLDVGQPRGKQEWRSQPHVIWYARTTGIWQSVWLEAVPDTAVTEIAWTPSRACDAVELEVTMSRQAPAGTRLVAELSVAGRALASASVTLPACSIATLTVPLREMVHGQQYEELLWSPEHPLLIDAQVRLHTTPGAGGDEVSSYLGLRSVGVERRRFLLNDRPYYVRAVLEQGFWPDSHLAAPGDEALREEVALIKSLGFNAARLHQKVEDPRFLYWADRLGLLVWAEAPAPYEFTTQSVTRLVAEWTAAVRRDRAHPCVVTWVPFNESWGVQHIGNRPQQQAFSRALSDLTRALDPSRPVVSNDGWEHTDSDILTIHDYDPDNEAVRARYRDAAAVAQMIAGFGPAGRTLLAQGHTLGQEAPVMVSEFGGIRYAPDDPGSWGYTSATSAEDLEERLARVFGALHASEVLSGFCYTQLTDTMQEANGLADERRRPKTDVERIRAIVVGTHPTS